MNDMDHSVYTYKVPELTSEEKKLPCARFYEDYPLYKPSPLQQQILDAGPMDPKYAIKAENWLDLLQVKGYRDVIYGYCMMDDGSGFYIEYSVTPPTWRPEWRRWFSKWVNTKSPGMVPGQGSLRYKIWNPVDHWDHRFVNGVDDKDGIWSMETLDLGASGDPSSGIGAVSHNIDLREYGRTEEKQKELEAHGCRASACYEEFEGPGHHLVLRFSRPCPQGGTENINCEWIGWYPKDGKIVRDPDTPCSEEYLKNVLIHNSVERVHLVQVLPDLYEAYHDKPLDAD